jgi:predicted SnoaL-like aldol condensation-catalyzing enzyme
MPSNKELALRFLELATTGRVPQAFEELCAEDFVHHNPYTPAGRQALQDGMQASDAQFPDRRFRALHALEDGDYVAIHSHVILKPGELELAALHLFRFKDGKIAELWDVGQQIPKDNKNEKGMF